MDGEVPARAEHSYTITSDRLEMGTARDQLDVHPGAIQGGADVCTDGTGADNSDSHRNSDPSVATVFCLQYAVGEVNSLISEPGGDR
ncbi:hypothetical protein GCM10009780_01350 [Actinomadura alba]